MNVRAPSASPIRSAKAAEHAAESRDAAREALTKLAFGTGPMIEEKLLQRYLDSCPDKRTAYNFLRQLFPVMYRLKPDAQRLLTRTVLNLA